VGVEPVGAACLTASLEAGRPAVVATPGTVMAGLDCAEISAAAWSSLRAGISATVTVSDAEALAARDELERHGLLIGESGAAPLAALAHLTTLLRPESRVLLIATEGRTGDV
jgi:diaminopropionate ammonia-lyase